MSDVRTILIPCGACGHKTSTTVAQWSAGFACESCGATVQRPTPGGKKKAAEEKAKTPSLPTARVAPTAPSDSTPKSSLKQARTVSSGIGLPGPGTPAPPPLAGAAELSSPTETRSLQMRHASQRADDIAADLQTLQKANEAQSQKVKKLIEENRELKVTAQRLSLERQSAELDATAELQRLKAENQVIREKFDELVKERVQLRSNLSMLEAKCHRLESDGGKKRAAVPTADTMALRKKVAELSARDKIICEKFEQIQDRYRTVRQENAGLTKRIAELEAGGGGGSGGTQERTLKLRLEREQKKSEELEKQNRELTDQSLQLEVENGMMKERLATVEDQLATVAKDGSAVDADLQAQLAKAQQEAEEVIAAAQRDVAEVEAERDKLKADADSHSRAVAELKQELAASRQQEEDLDAKLQQIRQREDELAAKLDHAESDLAELRDRLNAQQSGESTDDLIDPAEMQRLQERLQSLEAERAAIGGDEKSTNQQMDAIHVENTVLREKLDELVGELAAKEVGPSPEAYARLEIENKLLREKLDDMLGPAKKPEPDAADSDDQTAKAAPEAKTGKADKETSAEKPDPKPEEDAATDAKGVESSFKPKPKAESPPKAADADAAKPAEDEPEATPAPAKKKKKAVSAEDKRRAALARKLKKAKAQAARKKEDGSE